MLNFDCLSSNLPPKFTRYVAFNTRHLAGLHDPKYSSNSFQAVLFSFADPRRNKGF